MFGLMLWPQVSRALEALPVSHPGWVEEMYGEYWSSRNSNFTNIKAETYTRCFCVYYLAAVAISARSVKEPAERAEIATAAGRKYTQKQGM